MTTPHDLHVDGRPRRGKARVTHCRPHQDRVRVHDQFQKFAGNMHSSPASGRSLMDRCAVGRQTEPRTGQTVSAIGPAGHFSSHSAAFGSSPGASRIRAVRSLAARHSCRVERTALPGGFFIHASDQPFAVQALADLTPVVHVHRLSSASVAVECNSAGRRYGRVPKSYGELHKQEGEFPDVYG